MIPRLSPDLCAALRSVFQRVGYDVDGVPELLGEAAHAALGRDEPVPARLASRGGGALGTLVRLFLLGDTEPEAAVAQALAPLTVADALAAGLLRPGDPVPDSAPGPAASADLAARVDPTGLAAALDVRPHGDDEGSWWVVSDLDLGRSHGQPRALSTD